MYICVQVRIVSSIDGSMGEKYQYGITSLADKRDFLQTGDVIKFRVAVMRGSGKRRATNITAVRKYIRAKVESIKVHTSVLVLVYVLAAALRQ